MAKEAWTNLQTSYEGTKAVKASKLQMLTSSFENIRMGEDETFDEFYVKIKGIVNSVYSLKGTIIEEPKIFRILGLSLGNSMIRPMLLRKLRT